MKKIKNLPLKLFVAITYMAMIFVNFLANYLPIAGVNTGEVSDSYPNLFAPAGLTFSIWGIIYLLLLGYTIYQFGFWQKNNNSKKEELFAKIGKYFSLSSVANSIWIFCWHYGILWLSVLIMLFMLFCLIKIANIINKDKHILSDTLFIRLPFSVYFGWITVATIANITAFLVNIGWTGFGLSESIWMIMILLIGTTIGILRALKDNNIAYILVFVWAYGGIWLKHTSKNGFNGLYPNIITTTIICILFFIATIGFLEYKKISSKSDK